MDAIQKISGLLQRFIMFVLFSLLFGFLYTHVFNDITSYNFPTIKGSLISPLDAQSQQILTVLNLLPLYFEMYITFCLIMILDYCKQGKLLAEDTRRYLGRIGITLLCFTLVLPITQLGMSVTLRKFTEGHFFLSITTSQIILAVTGIGIIFFSLILKEAGKIKQEHDTFF